MQAVESTTEQPANSPGTRRKPAEIRFPAYNLADSLAVAQAIHEQGGGLANKVHLAAFLGYKTTNSGAFLSRVAAARTFGLIDNRGRDYVITPLAQKILMPVYPEQAEEGLVEAFLTAPLFKAVYEEHIGREIPPEFGMKNLFRNRYGLAADRAALSYRLLMESAEAAGFFRTRGARTHLIIPQIRPGAAQPAVEPEAPVKDGGGGPPTGPTVPANPDQVRLEYVRKLISLLGDESIDQMELMDRIERLLGNNGAHGHVS